ncbi:SsgA family sporulation/cell division regulator [Streptomyces sp. MUM 203J]|uniref:SsgA family sporulation/cell division regulator n=1 Tax=Streptomyces sp. MUM 203J TaxID=2791990 RepID=UPI001F0393F7|nr:SsgA family sporulation/cell division regulator [Streptomyces sp. MUM 203J]MCH0540167.1 SsgA family sporulation/cell division regulator [Streptomyces sp. MUM 203J]
MCPSGGHPDDDRPLPADGPRVRVRAKGLAMTDGPLASPVPVELRYDGDAAPATVRFDLPGGDTWTFPRTLLEAGLTSPARRGAVEVWPCGRVQTVVEFHSAEGTEVFQFDSATLLRFLRRTYAASTPVVR